MATDGPEVERPTRARWLARTMRWIVVAACIGALAGMLAGYRSELAVLTSLQPASLLPACGLLVAYLFVFSLRFQLILERISGWRPGFVYLFELMTLARLLNQTAPQLGNVYRGVRLKQELGVEYAHYVSSLGAVAWLCTLINVVLALIIAAVDGPAPTAGGQTIWGVLAGIATSMIVLPALVIVMLGRLADRAPTQGRIAEALNYIAMWHEGLYRLAVAPRALFGFTVLSLIMFGLMGGVFHFLFASLGISITLFQIATLYLLYRLTMLIMLTPGNLGVRELVIGGAAGELGMGMTEGVLVTILIRLLSYSLLALLALGLLLHRSRR